MNYTKKLTSILKALSALYLTIYKGPSVYILYNNPNAYLGYDMYPVRPDHSSDYVERIIRMALTDYSYVALLINGEKIFAREAEIPYIIRRIIAKRFL